VNRGGTNGWIPAYAGMTMTTRPLFRASNAIPGIQELEAKASGEYAWISAFARMMGGSLRQTSPKPFQSQRTNFPSDLLWQSA
jgi:hypothetical protein